MTDSNLNPIPTPSRQRLTSLQRPKVSSRSSVVVVVTVVTAVADVAATAETKSVTPNGKSGWFRSAVSPKP